MTLFPIEDATLGVDGYQLVGTVESDFACCAPKLCDMDPCSIACSMVNLLPRGPLWDKAKAQAMDRYQRTCGEITCEPAIDGCTSMAAHAVYSGFRLYDMLMLTLFPALRESNPLTACTSMDDWLERLGWSDCFRGACRDPQFREITPYDNVQTCLPTFCERAVDPPKLAAAVKHGIIVALWRARLGFIKNVDGFNWILAPLGVAVDTLQQTTNPPCPLVVTLKPIASTLPCWQCTNCLSNPEQGQCTVPASFTVDDQTCNVPEGETVTIWPGLLAAECIVRSYLLRGSNDSGITFKRQTA